ncbi:MAG: hypothetical protein NC453_15535 [Muribaculum sp.]|nr:hypothetical protein [Muribaculum sp.]
MILSTLGMVATAAILSAILSFVITKFTKRLKGIGCVSFIGLTFVFSFVLAFTLPKVVIIDKESNDFTHKSRYALFSYNGRHVSFCDTYMDNKTADILIVYPVWYGNAETQTRDLDDEPTVIEANSFVEINREPDNYFYIPSSIYTKKTKKAKCKWCVEPLDKVLGREETEKEKTKKLFESILP